MQGAITSPMPRICLKSTIRIQAVVDFSNTWLQPLGFQLGMFHPIQFGNQLLLDLGIVKGELPSPAQIGIQLGRRTASFEDPIDQVLCPPGLWYAASRTAPVSRGPF